MNKNPATNSEQKPHKISRRTFLKRALVAGGAILAGGIGYRKAHNANGRDYDVARSEALLANIAPGILPQEPPNIVLIFVDDLGYADLSCFGSQAIHTPNLDQMATEGVRMTHFCATAPLCSPSRAGLLSGRYPIRTHITMPLYPSGSGSDIIFTLAGAFPYDVKGIPEDEILLPELLQRAGYRTALLGKWHLGDKAPHLPNQNGFDLFLGAYYSNNRQPYAIYRNEELEMPAPADQNALTQAFTKEAIRFIKENRDRPFFLYYAQPFPHIPLHASEAFRGKSKAGLYGDTVEEIDWSVGEILKTLREQGLDENTLVIFTSDHGPWWQGNPGFARGRKNLIFEGGFRVPFIARWPGTLPTGRETDAMSMNFDIFSTCLAVAGVPAPKDRIIDGCNLLPILKGEQEAVHDTLFYYKYDRLLGVRHKDWKYLRRHMTDNGGYASLSHGPFLFNLSSDPNESYSLIESEPEVAEKLIAMMADWDEEMRDNLRGWL